MAKYHVKSIQNWQKFMMLDLTVMFFNVQVGYSEVLLFQGFTCELRYGVSIIGLTILRVRMSNQPHHHHLRDIGPHNVRTERFTNGLNSQTFLVSELRNALTLD